MSDLFSLYGEQPIWVAFSYERKANGKVSKKPINPVTGEYASSKDPATWGTLKQAEKRCLSLQKQGRECGVGMHTKGAPDLCFFDLDDCFEKERKPKPWAARVLKQTGNAFAHVTPSGRGLRIVVDETIEEVHRTLDMGDGQLEVFQNTNRFVVVTDDIFEDRFELNLDGQGVRDALIKKAARQKPGLLSANQTYKEFQWGDDTGAEFDPTHCVEGQRSETFASDIYSMLRKRMTPIDCVRNLTGALCAEKYESEGRLEQEVQRVCGKFLGEHGELPCFAKSEQTVDRHDNRIVADSPAKPSRSFLSLNDILVPIPQRWLVHDQIPMGTTGVLFGEPGTKKTFYCLNVGLSLASRSRRLPFHCDEDFEPPIRHHFVMIAGEGQTTLRTRIGAWRQMYGVRYPHVTFQTFAEDFTDQGSIDVLAKDLIDHLDRVDPNAPIFLVVDTLSQNMVGDENGDGVTKFIRNLERLRSSLARNGKEATAMAVHHSKKDGTEYRGHSSLQGNSDFMLQLKNTSDPLRVELIRYKSKVAETGVTIGEVCFEQVVLMKEDFLDEPTDEPEDGMNETLVVLPSLGQRSTPHYEMKREEFLERTYYDGIKQSEWSRTCSEEFGITKTQATRIIEDFVKSRPALSRDKGKGGSWFVYGGLNEASLPHTATV